MGWSEHRERDGGAVRRVMGGQEKDRKEIEMEGGVGERERERGR